MEIEKNHTCCFIGHRVMIETEKLSKALQDAIERLIVEEKVHTFLFSGKAKFDNLCFYIVSHLKQKYPYIQRIKTRTDFPFINGDFNDYIMDSYYDDTYYPGRILNTRGMIYQGKSEKERIDMSGFCIVFHDKSNDFLEELLYDSEEFTAKAAMKYAKSKGICMIQVG